MTSINQWIPAAHRGDAIGDSARRVRDLLRRLGHDSHIYALTIDEDMRDEVRPFDDPQAQMIYDVAKSLHEGKGIAKPLYDEAVKLIGERGVVEIIGLCGYYTLVSMTLNAFQFDLPPGETSELEG